MCILAVSAVGRIVAAQEYHPLLQADASWDVAILESADLCLWISGRTHHISGDTLLEDLVYSTFEHHGIYSVNGPAFCPPLYAFGPEVSPSNIFLREDTNQRIVYLYDAEMGIEKVCYDYNRAIGDTIHDYFEMETGPTIVTGRDSVMLDDGSYRDRWLLATDGVEHDYLEGVGSTFGLVHRFPHDFGDGEHLWCYKREIALYSPHYCASPASVGLSDGPVSSGSDPFAARTVDEKRILYRSAAAGSLMLSGVDGRLIAIRQLPPALEWKELRTGDLLPGPYLYRFTPIAGVPACGKLVLE